VPLALGSHGQGWRTPRRPRPGARAEHTPLFLLLSCRCDADPAPGSYSSFANRCRLGRTPELTTRADRPEHVRRFSGICCAGSEMPVVLGLLSNSGAHITLRLRPRACCAFAGSAALVPRPIPCDGVFAALSLTLHPGPDSDAGLCVACMRGVLGETLPRAAGLLPDEVGKAA